MRSISGATGSSWGNSLDPLKSMFLLMAQYAGQVIISWSVSAPISSPLTRETSTGLSGVGYGSGKTAGRRRACSFTQNLGCGGLQGTEWQSIAAVQALMRQRISF